MIHRQTDQPINQKTYMSVHREVTLPIMDAGIKIGKVIWAHDYLAYQQK